MNKEDRNSAKTWLSMVPYVLKCEQSAKRSRSGYMAIMVCEGHKGIIVQSRKQLDKWSTTRQNNFNYHYPDTGKSV